MKITSKQFKKFSEIVYHECGINLHEGKKQLLNARLSKRLRQTGINSVEEYLRCIEHDTKELNHFLDAISTNHTFFFRESHHFECLENSHLDIWCAAASSGEEPYSVAIYCLEKGFRPTIFATDISTKVLKVAEQGIYSFEKAKTLPSHTLRRYFRKGQGNWEGYIKIKDEIKTMVTFKRFNLVSDTAATRLYDVIFCRNVMIYFDNAVRERVVEKLYSSLKSGGYFIIGGAESLNGIKHKYKYVRPSIYRKIER